MTPMHKDTTGLTKGTGHLPILNNPNMDLSTNTHKMDQSTNTLKKDMPKIHKMDQPKIPISLPLSHMSPTLIVLMSISRSRKHIRCL